MALIVNANHEAIKSDSEVTSELNLIYPLTLFDQSGRVLLCHEKEQVTLTDPASS